MKKVLIGGALAACTVLGLTTPYYLGGKAQQSLQIQHRALADTFFFDVVSHEYERGWFSSTEKTVLRFHPMVLQNIESALPDNIRAVLQKPITMINHVRHQPFANGIKPVRAVVETEFVYDADVQKTLARFFGEQAPLKLHNIIDLSGNGILNIQVAPFEYEELSGIKLDWRGLTGQVQYEDGFVRYATQLHAPAFKAILADKGSLQLDDVRIQTQTAIASNGKTALGSSQSSLARAELVWKDNINYNVRLNDLVNMVSDLQIGAFINPNGTITPNHIVLEQVQYATQTSEPSAGFIDSEGKFSFAKLHYGTEQYGPLNIDIVAEHLHADSLTQLKTRWQHIATEKLPEEQQREALLKAVRNEGLGIFTHNPVFQVRQFDFTTPNGYLKAAGSLQFHGVQAADLDALPSLLAKMKAQLNLDVSQNLIENFAVQQTRSLFTVEDPTSEQEQQEISDTIKMLTQQTLDTMSNEGYLHQKNGAIQTQLTVADNRITLNGKPFQMQSDEDLFVGLEDDMASQPASDVAQ